MEYLLDPTKLTQYVTENCETRVVGGEDDIGYFQLFVLSEIPPGIFSTIPDSDQQVLLCLDNFGAWDTYVQCDSSPC